MDYKRLNEDEIEIIPEAPVEKVLETIARVSYELARPLGMVSLSFHPSGDGNIDYSKFVSPDGLFMDYVKGRQCKTFVRYVGGKLVFHASRYERDRGSPELLLDKVKETLKNKFEDSENTGQPNKPVYWDKVEVAGAQYGIQIDPNNARQSRLRVALALNGAGREIEAVEVMTGKRFENQAMDVMLLLTNKPRYGSPEKFYSGFPNIDRT